MAVIQITHRSQTLGKECQLLLIAPDQQHAALPVVYLLHDYGESANSWIRHTAIERYALDAGVMVVMPDGGKGWYSDAVCGHYNHESHILETITFIDQHFDTIAYASGRGVGGVGMGGYGALKLGLKHRELFRSVVAQSAVIDVQQQLAQGDSSLPLVFGSQIDADNDLSQLIGNTNHLPHIMINCGSGDPLAEENRDFHKLLQSKHIPHRFSEFPGSHEWRYWDAHLAEAMAFHAKHLGR